MQVADGVHRVDGVRVSNAYLVLGEDGLVLVDSGMRGNAKRILTAIERVGRGPSELRFVVLTHYHIDHVGSAAEIRRLTGARIAIHELDAPVLAGIERPRKGRLAMALLDRIFRNHPFAPDLTLRDGDDVAGLRVIHVPGHTAGSIVLRRDDGVVFCGDTLLTDRHGNVVPPNPSLSLDPAQVLESAERIKALRPRVLLSGHGAPASGVTPTGG